MRSPTHYAFALAAAGMTLALAAPGQAQAAGGTAGESATITVHRGAQVSRVSNGVESPVSPAEQTSGVSVVRGRGPVPGAAPDKAQQATRPIRLVAGDGEVVWLLDADDGHLTACELLHTADLGVRKIRCHARDLPR